MLIQVSFLISGLSNERRSSLQAYEIVAEIFADYDLEVRHFSENSK
jgi:hypothetical protein